MTVHMDIRVDHRLKPDEWCLYSPEPVIIHKSRAVGFTEELFHHAITPIDPPLFPHFGRVGEPVTGDMKPLTAEEKYLRYRAERVFNAYQVPPDMFKGVAHLKDQRAGLDLTTMQAKIFRELLEQEPDVWGKST